MVQKSRKRSKPPVLLAFGGHVLEFKESEFGPDPIHPAAVKCMEAVVTLHESGYRKIIMTHGNGPQVGELLLQQHLVRKRIKNPATLDVCVADTQGRIGYALQQIFDNLCIEKNIRKKTSAVITQVVVDAEDPAFLNPTKPVGVFYQKEEAKKLRKDNGWKIKYERGRGYRRVVPSPEPLEIIEQSIFRELLALDFLAIGAGGGGIPVVREEGGLLNGVEAVIDKDKTSSLLATQTGIHTFVILTEVPEVYLHYKTSRQQPLGEVKVRTLKRYLKEGHFFEGSMKPKVEAAIRFIEQGGSRAIITSIDQLFNALKGDGGTAHLG